VGVLTRLDPLPESGVVGSALIAQAGTPRRRARQESHPEAPRRAVPHRAVGGARRRAGGEQDRRDPTLSYPAALAAKQRAGPMPIVVFGSGDPVRTGTVKSLSRPGGNITKLFGWPSFRVPLQIRCATHANCQSSTYPRTAIKTARRRRPKSA